MENRALDTPYIAISAGIFAQCRCYTKPCATNVSENIVCEMPQFITINLEAPINILIQRA